MAYSQHIIDDPHDLSFDQIFDLRQYYEEDSSEPQSTPFAEPQTLDDPDSSSQTSMPEPHQEEMDLSEVAPVTFNSEAALMDTWYNSQGRPSTPAIDARNEPLHQYGQPSLAKDPVAELHDVEHEIEQVNLELRLKDLQKKRQTLIQSMPLPNQAQTSERPQSQHCRTANIPSTNTRVCQPYISTIVYLM